MTHLKTVVFYFSILLFSSTITASDFLDKQDRFGKTPLHTAISSRSWKIVQLLIERGARPDIKDNDGITPEQLIIELAEQGNKSAKELLPLLNPKN